ncbi:DNA-binding HxlR family transcriptional regulator [Lipingzhangella halophila]|uniref:DNA-binding HxlR family transcriptional regulator n=1 Tax=Lipingzhangella halophila TaxID=1783352 RepID=A0A7W7RPM1_9ACTN|nr:helix-turn-helix domain-containing protein [Lipingzhangella halophila]MBB4935572.1 DNA-binding HxlR family transcriptional regulator [Lipingzhangella halophila]
MANQMVSDAAQALRQDCPGATPLPNSSCPIENTLSVLRRRWAALVILELLHGPRSFNELAQNLGRISDKILTERLTELTDANVLHRKRTSGWPSRVRYSLTQRGHDLAAVLQAMRIWGSTE